MLDEQGVPKRRSTRLRSYDYREEGAYFVTICTYQRAHTLSLIANGEVKLSMLGQIVESEWLRTQTARSSVELDAFVIMPNHLHGIMVLSNTQPASQASERKTLSADSLGAIIGQFKSIVSKRAKALEGHAFDVRIWQRNYYDHVIRDDADLNRLRAYIESNPIRWEEDSLYK